MAEFQVFKWRDQKSALLGIVSAKNAPDALLQAFEIWKARIDPHQVQGGFYVRPVKQSSKQDSPT